MIIDINLSESVGNPTQEGKSFAQRGMNLIPKGMDFIQFDSRDGKIEFENKYNPLIHSSLSDIPIFHHPNPSHLSGTRISPDISRGSKVSLISNKFLDSRSL
jgi:hypothetical protein